MDQKEKSPAEMMQESLDKPTWGHLPWGTGEGSPFADKISADMSKKAGAYDKAVMALLKVLSAARKAKGVAATAGGAVARGVGAAGAGAKWGLGKVFSKMPGTFLKSTGKQMVANTSPYFAGGTAGGQMILPGMSSYMQKELGKKLLGRTAKTFLHPFGIGNLFVWSPYGYAINKVTGEPAEMDENGNLSEDDIAQAQQMMAWLEANRGGSLKPFVPQNVAMQLPDYDITEIPGGFDVPDTIPDQAGLPKVQGPGQEVGLNDQDGGVA